MPRLTAARKQEIRDLLTKLDQSSLSVAEFARQQDVSVWKLYTWRKKYGLRDDTEARNQGRADLVEVSPTQPVAHGIELVVADVVVRVPLGFDADELARVIEVARRC